jgi:hypothetical protein
MSGASGPPGRFSFPMPPRWAAKGQGDVQGDACAGQAVEGDPATERLDPVLEPKPGPTMTEVRAAPPVVANPTCRRPSWAVATSAAEASAYWATLVSASATVWEAAISLGKLPLDLDIQGDGDGRAAGQRSERRPQPARGEHSRVQATSDLPRFLKHASHP